MTKLHDKNKHEIFFAVVKKWSDISFFENIIHQFTYAYNYGAN